MSDKTQIPYKIYLAEEEMPAAWYNVRADMKKKAGSAFESRNIKTMYS